MVKGKKMMFPEGDGAWRNRKKEIRRVKASDLVRNEGNWRVHPEFQRRALRGALSEIGDVDVLKVVEQEDGSLLIVDGHLRASEAGDDMVDVVILDLNDEEVSKVLATYDPLTALAEGNAALYDAAIEAANFEDDYLRQTILQERDALREAEEGRSRQTSNIGSTEDGEIVHKQSVQLTPQREYIVIMCRDEEEWALAREVFQLGAVRRGGYRPGSEFDDVGTERVLTLRDAISRIRGE